MAVGDSALAVEVPEAAVLVVLVPVVLVEDVVEPVELVGAVLGAQLNIKTKLITRTDKNFISFGLDGENTNSIVTTML